MTWSATERYALEPAPGGLAFVQDLLNTSPAGRPRHADWLDDPTTAQTWLNEALARWSAASGRPAPAVDLTDRDREALRNLRWALRRLLSDGSDGAEAMSAQVLAAFPALSVSMQVDERGTVVAEPSGTGWRRVASLALIECLQAQQTDQRRRLKICRNERCPCAFYDRSRNNSGVWHDVRFCGNAANLRAYRARKREQAASGN
ncbi:hypothetical protein GCM10018793_24080 [Streptomyces sulfonofaciens]|uniref:Zinc finger CGNR domain-containing protein n=1 Tax=Streptomyces sulfonofaciens TaxID=68272 RepID=A0A919G2F8_9ACTN|nr:CGNR zinc finger domain-containing protein [Streptomyces sulfonofaciens]GHH76957.1 hypothetical protein GCM10018793_24080 [Streptomyces sulfonofaciens]